MSGPIQPPNNPQNAANLGFPVGHVPLIDPATGMVTPQWYRFFLALNNQDLITTGMIMAFAVPDIPLPLGWLLCDGSPVSRQQWSNLFGLVGITYGPGDGITTFNLPNIQSYNTVMPSGPVSILWAAVRWMIMT